MAARPADQEASAMPAAAVLPPHWQRTATHYERRPWQPRVMVLYSLTAIGPRRFAWHCERMTSLWIYASVGEAIAAVEAVLARQVRRDRRCPAAPGIRKRRPRRADPRQPDLFAAPGVQPRC